MAYTGWRYRGCNSQTRGMKNPNMIFLVNIPFERANTSGTYSEDWFGWLRDEDGNLILADPLWSYRILDCRKYKTLLFNRQFLFQNVACMMESTSTRGWKEMALPSKRKWNGSDRLYSTWEEERAASLSILQRSVGMSPTISLYSLIEISKTSALSSVYQRQFHGNPP